MLAEIVNNTNFLRQIQEFIMPILVRQTTATVEDDQGTTKLVNNQQGSRRMRHIHVKQHIVRDVIEEGLVRFSSFFFHVRSDDLISGYTHGRFRHEDLRVARETLQ